jgi:aspartate-semialdehyde dehydrogenase
MKKVRLAVVGVTEMVGQKFLEVLEQRIFPFDELYLFASAKSAGKKINFKDTEYTVEELKEFSLI